MPFERDFFNSSAFLQSPNFTVFTTTTLATSFVLILQYCSHIQLVGRRKRTNRATGPAERLMCLPGSESAPSGNCCMPPPRFFYFELPFLHSACGGALPCMKYQYVLTALLRLAFDYHADAPVVRIGRRATIPTEDCHIHTQYIPSMR